MLDVDALRPRPTIARCGAYLVAACAYLLIVLLVVGGIGLVAFRFPDPFTIVVGVICVSIGVFMRPRIGEVPSENVVAREDAPRLHALVDRVATALETPTADCIVVDSGFNASWAVLGVRRRRVLTLGLPLLAALEPDERVALAAHELAHARNGDSSRGLVVGSALRGLQHLCAFLAPGASVVFGELAFAARMVNGRSGCSRARSSASCTSSTTC